MRVCRSHGGRASARIYELESAPLHTKIQVMHRGAAHIIDFLKDQRVQQSIFEAEAALRHQHEYVTRARSHTHTHCPKSAHATHSLVQIEQRYKLGAKFSSSISCVILLVCGVRGAWRWMTAWTNAVAARSFSFIRCEARRASTRARAQLTGGGTQA